MSEFEYILSSDEIADSLLAMAKDVEDAKIVALQPVPTIAFLKESAQHVKDQKIEIERLRAALKQALHYIEGDICDQPETPFTLKLIREALGDE